MKNLLRFFTIVAAAGLVLSAASHLAAITASEGPLGDSAAVLHLGIFIVWIPAVFVSNHFAKNYPRKDFWKVVLHGCPGWMKYMTYGFFGYAMLNFVLFVIRVPKQALIGPMTPQVVRGFSGHWMVFYSAALAILYSAAKRGDEGRE